MTLNSIIKTKPMKVIDKSFIQLNDLELRKETSLLASQLNAPVLMLSREFYDIPSTGVTKLRYTLYFKSNLDENFVVIKRFHSVDDFCLWYVSKHPFKQFELLNYSQV